MLNRTSWVKSALFRHVGGVCFFGGGVAPNVAVNAVELYGCLKPVSVASNAKIAAGVSWLRAALVLHIHRCRNITQIVESVVRLIAVDVVNVSGGPCPAHEKPRKTVRRVKTLIDTKANVPMRGFASSNIAGPCFMALSRCQASENAGFWVVVKKLAQTLRGKIGLSHDAVLSLIGQRPARVDSTGGLRYFSGSHAILHEANRR